MLHPECYINFETSDGKRYLELFNVTKEERATAIISELGIVVLPDPEIV